MKGSGHLISFAMIFAVPFGLALHSRPQKSIEYIADFKKAYELASRDGIMTNTFDFGSGLEHVAARAREYHLFHSVPEVSNGRKNGILQQVLTAMAELNRPISFRAAADIHQQLSELMAHGATLNPQRIRYLVEAAPLREDERDSIVFSEAQVARIKANKGKPVKGDSAQPGGIDLTSDKTGVQVQTSGPGVQFKYDPAMIQPLQDSSGLTPVIVDIQPMTTTVSMFLGLKDDVPAGQLSMR